MPRVALSDSCSYAGYLGVSTIHTFKINRFLASSLTNPTSQLQLRHHRQLHATHLSTLQDPTGYPRILAIDHLRPL
jgi:hypothetical protein